ncbi:hypothetical protein V499_08410 [Pseudogymnoascus sp. VKM F-103]|uniref:Uncharacterized protein n=1 Tax=Pseudogymnoascus verrucosus TaxID=342668 RepID=A0A1B8GTC3_9PEZI|nr:uncharacterized protein VE01_02395 [Pseudogymnoascus verrucosus]KFY71398.1 hypothetical protein V499_08410 [Pseudogymnoascus sp. VKM F-103]OBT99077.1 hypothetical protein VE01_02395 [Pseudogymnoascus verrucosus]
MMFSRYLVGLSIVGLAAAIAAYNRECGPTLEDTAKTTDAEFYFDVTEDVDLFVRCAETVYECDTKLYNARWFMIDSTKEPVPVGCRKQLGHLTTSHNYTGPLEVPGLTELYGLGIRGTYEGTYEDNGLLLPTNVTSIDLPDLVNIANTMTINNAASITSLNLPKLRHINKLLLNFTGGPAINLTFPSLVDVSSIAIYGEIDTLDFPALNETRNTIMVNSTGNLDCDTFSKSLVNTTRYDQSGVSCASRRGNVTLTHVEPPKPTVTSGAFKIPGGSLALTALLAYILAL